jgi:hypothetical protein
VLERVADAVVTGRILAPPITRIRLDDVSDLNGGLAEGNNARAAR